MPVTPIHSGIGMIAKAILTHRFSLVSFLLVQVLIDLESAWYLIRFEPPFHRFWHTYLGATIVAAILMVVGKPVSQWIKGIWNRVATKCHDVDLSVTVQTTWIGALAGAVFGAYSHIFVDSLFHPDIEPLQPWSASNRLYGVINPLAVESGCILLGVVGLVLFLWRERKRRKANQHLHVISTSRGES